MDLLCPSSDSNNVALKFIFIMAARPIQGRLTIDICHGLRVYGTPCEQEHKRRLLPHLLEFECQERNFSEAERYVRCAWQIREIGEIGDHLGQIYEKEGRKAEAIELYSMALAAPFPMTDTRARLVALLASDTDLNRLTQEARSGLVKSRTLEIKNAHDAFGMAEFWLLLVTGPKVSSVKFISGDESLRPFAGDLETAKLTDPFPGATDAKLLRRGRLTCSSSSTPCSLVLMSVETVRSAD